MSATTVNGRLLTDAQADRLRSHAADVARGGELRRAALVKRQRTPAETSADLAMATRIEAAGVRGLRQLAAELAADADSEQARADLDATAAIRHDLGDVITRTLAGAMQIVTALDKAHAKGVLNGATVPAAGLLSIGNLYRDVFEASNGLRTAAKNEIRGSGGGGAQEAIVQAGQVLARLRKDQPARQVTVLDGVCGFDRTVFDTAKGMGVDYRHAERWLRAGLVMCCRNKKIA
jgi:hypothetical protein